MNEVVALVSLGFISIGMIGLSKELSKRAQQFLDFKLKIIQDESEWIIDKLSKHPEIVSKLISNGDALRRYDSLPCLARSVFSFWHPIEYYEKKVKPVKDYYKEIPE
jgi:hypothetical protein